MVHRRRSTDASQLRFPIQLVVLIATMSTSAAVTIWTVRSDIRDLRTRLEGAAKLEEANSRLQDERSSALKEALSAVQRDQRMTQFEVQSLKESLMKMQSGIDANNNRPR